MQRFRKNFQATHSPGTSPVTGEKIQKGLTEQSDPYGTPLNINYRQYRPGATLNQTILMGQSNKPSAVRALILKSSGGHKNSCAARAAKSNNGGAGLVRGRRGRLRRLIVSAARRMRTALHCAAHCTRMSCACALCAKPPGRRRRQNVNAGSLVTAARRSNVIQCKARGDCGVKDEWGDRKTTTTAL